MVRDSLAMLLSAQMDNCPGGDYSASALDIGLGLHPDLVGQGYGGAFIEAILAFATQTFTPEALRLTVAAFNHRARQLYEDLEFERTARFYHNQTEYLVLVKPVTTRQGH